jgi:hypothetical protein
MKKEIMKKEPLEIRMSIRITPKRMEQLYLLASSLESTPAMLVRGWIAEKLKEAKIKKD